MTIWKGVSIALAVIGALMFLADLDGREERLWEDGLLCVAGVIFSLLAFGVISDA